jgi:hypothetical protein
MYDNPLDPFPVGVGVVYTMVNIFQVTNSPPEKKCGCRRRENISPFNA